MAVEGYGQQTRLTALEATDIIPWERGGPAAPYPASVELSLLATYIQSQITAGSIVGFGSDRNAVASPANNQVFFDTDDGICYQYATVGGWTAKLDFVSSAELTTAIASFLTQSAADTRYVQAAVLSESIDDRVAALLVAGTNTTLTYNDTANTLTIAASIPNESIDDRVAALLLAGSNISLDYDYTANTLTIASTATSSGGGASGLKFTYNSTEGSSTAGEIRAASLAVGGAIAINPTDAQGNAWTDLASRLVVGAIIQIAEDGDNWVRGTITAAYTSGSVTIGSVVAGGVIASLSTVYLSLWSDAPSPTVPTTNGSVVVGTLTAFGDSITVGDGATTALGRFIDLVQADTGWSLTNNAVSGREVIDMADSVFGSAPSNSTQYLWLAGFNDLRNYQAVAAGQQTFSGALQALTAWLAIPATKRKKAQESGVTYVGGWTNGANYGGALVKLSSTVGNTATFSFSGSAFIVGHTRLPTGTGSFTISIDGGAAITVTGANAIASLQGRTYAPAISIITGLAETFHTAVITVTSGSVNLEWMSGISQSTPAFSGPHVFVGNILRMGAAAFTVQPPNIDALIGIYNNLIKIALQPLIEAGLKVVSVNTNDRFLLGDLSADDIHPNNAGHQAIATAFIDKIRVTPGLLSGGSGGSGGSASPTPLTFSTRTANLSASLVSDSSGSVDYANCYGLADQSLPGDGYVSFNTTTFQDVVLGFNPSNANQAYPNYEYGVWRSASTYFTTALGTVANSGVATANNNLLRLRRAGATVTAEVSANNGGTWTVIRTFPVTTTATLYINVNIGGDSRQMVSPVGVGLP
jgi:hypothetical protein